MNTIKRYVRLTGFFATLAAGLVLSAAIDGANAKEQAREGSGAVSNPARTESRSMLAEKPVDTGTKPFRNTIHPIIVKPDQGDKHHGRKHDDEHGSDRGHLAVYECFVAPCPTYVPRRGWLTKPAGYVVKAPGSAPIQADTGAGGASTRGSDDMPSASSSKTEQ